MKNGSPCRLIDKKGDDKNESIGGCKKYPGKNQARGSSNLSKLKNQNGKWKSLKRKEKDNQ